jgi:hypothetical protein
MTAKYANHAKAEFILLLRVFRVVRGSTILKNESHP